MIAKKIVDCRPVKINIYVGTPLPNALGLAKSIPYGNSFAIIGGTDGSKDLDTAYIYDPAGAGSWRLLPNRLHQGRRQTIALTVKKEIFPACP